MVKLQITVDNNNSNNKIAHTKPNYRQMDIKSPFDKSNKLD